MHSICSFRLCIKVLVLFIFKNLLQYLYREIVFKRHRRCYSISRTCIYSEMFLYSLLVLVVFWCGPAHGVTCTPTNTGIGVNYRLEDTQDVYLDGSRNTIPDDPNLLRVGMAPSSFINRFLVQFENIPTSCGSMKWAKLFVYFNYSGRPGGLSPKQASDWSRTLQVHQVLVPWIESQATSIYRQTSPALIPWSQLYLALDGTDAVHYTQDSFTMSQQPPSYILFDITEAARNWLKGDPNNGLLVWATNDNTDLGTDLRFSSRRQTPRPPFINVLC